MTAFGTDAAIPEVAPDGSNFRTALIKARQVLKRPQGARRQPHVRRRPGHGSRGPAGRASAEGQRVRLRRHPPQRDARPAVRLQPFVADPSCRTTSVEAYHNGRVRTRHPPVEAAAGCCVSQQTVAQDGYALRWIQHYNPTQLEDQSVVEPSTVRRRSTPTGPSRVKWRPDGDPATLAGFPTSVTG